MDEYDSDDLNDSPVARSHHQKIAISPEIIAITTDDNATDDSQVNARSQAIADRRTRNTPAKSTKLKRRAKIIRDASLIESDVEQDIAPVRKRRKLRTIATKKTSKNNAVVYPDGTAEAEEGSVPGHLATRRQHWKSRRERLQLEGLMLPPDYDGLELSDDARLSTLPEKPIFKNIAPSRSYEDIALERSAGVIPASIAQWLRDYQVEGVEFLHEAFVYQKGIILGDDMGLGKTIQVISFLTAAFGKTGDERDSKRMRKKHRAGRQWYPRILIIAPASVMANWRSELAKWGWWTVYQYHGKDKDDALHAAEVGLLEIMITTYTTYQIDMDAINSIEWDCVIADECHIIKNYESKTTQALNAVNALCRIGLTGTAIQNKYEELWTLLNWTNPGQLGSLKIWKATISTPLKIGQSHDATLEQLGAARSIAENLVKNLLPRFFLRRMKTLIAHQLPKKSDKIVFCPPTPLQAEAYNNFCNSELVQRVIRATRDKERDAEAEQLLFFLLTKLQHLANHLALLVPNADDRDEERRERSLNLLKEAIPDQWQQLYTRGDSLHNFVEKDFSGKWLVLKQMLKVWHDNNDKVLIFSCSVRLLMMLHKLFATTSYSVSYIDGKTSVSERQAIVDDFNASPAQFVFLLSTRAGGVGLNITSANKVVVFDPTWNPANDLQAQDRAFRIGQTRDVDVFRLVTAGTIEENIYARQVYKQQQADIAYNATAQRRYFSGVQGDADHRGELFGLANLLRPQTDNLALKEIVNKTNIAESRAGVKIAELSLETTQDIEDEDSIEDSLDNEKGMSALVENIIDFPSQRKQKAERTTKKKKKKIDPIQAILDRSGVSYTHDNAQVIGTSRVEMQISSRARRTEGDIHPHQRRAFEGPQQMNTRLESDEEILPDYQYNPPQDVRHRQFCTMAKFMGYSDVSEFALLVQEWTQNQRRDFLCTFYEHRRDKCVSPEHT